MGGEAGEGGNGEREGARVEVGEEEISGGIDGGFGDEAAVRGFEAHGSARNGGAGGVDDRTTHGGQVLRTSRGGHGGDEKSQQTPQGHDLIIRFEA